MFYMTTTTGAATTATQPTKSVTFRTAKSPPPPPTIAAAATAESTTMTMLKPATKTWPQQHHHHHHLQHHRQHDSERGQHHHQTSVLQSKRPQKIKLKQWPRRATLTLLPPLLQKHQRLLVMSVVMLTLFTVTIEGITEELSPVRIHGYTKSIQMLFGKSTAIILCLAVIGTQAEMHFKTTSIECNPSLKYFTNYTCRLKAVNRYKSVGFLEGHIRNILRNVSVNFGLYVRNDVNIYRPFMLNITRNICRIFDKTATSGIYMSVFMKSIEKFTNVNHSCPYTGQLIARGLYVDFNMVPFDVPQMSYKFKFVFYEGYPFDSLGTISLYMDLIAAKKKS